MAACWSETDLQHATCIYLQFYSTFVKQHETISEQACLLCTLCFFFSIPVHDLTILKSQSNAIYVFQVHNSLCDGTFGIT